MKNTTYNEKTQKVEKEFTWYWDSLSIKHLRVIAFGDGYLESYQKRALQEIKKRTNKLKISDVH